MADYDSVIKNGGVNVHLTGVLAVGRFRLRNPPPCCRSTEDISLNADPVNQRMQQSNAVSGFFPSPPPGESGVWDRTQRRQRSSDPTLMAKKNFSAGSQESEGSGCTDHPRLDVGRKEHNTFHKRIMMPIHHLNLKRVGGLPLLFHKLDSLLWYQHSYHKNDHLIKRSYGTYDMFDGESQSEEEDL
ncbi:hypothetical protein F2P81_019221 [Scophthalmus maximus]|uniref:Uncharacterized protein n=1 Tax=Scophthalmus maximus TaxID=52904 RepID=A0A6A4SBC9_SCOMX|nr:hypothetical protein F2P81_019221 [Scophthalmus maximus]